MRSPYRLEVPLDRLIPPDRRRLHACALAFSCVLLGAVLLRGAEAFVAYLDAPPDTMAELHARSILLRSIRGASSPPIFPDVPRRGRPEIEQAREALLQGNPAIAKYLLMTRVASGNAKPEEVRLLQIACEAMKDRACLDFVRGR